LGVVQFENAQFDGAKPNKYYLVKQYDSQTLRSFINEFGRVEGRMVREYVRQIVRAVMHLHKSGLTHNRLTLESVLHDG
jgi:serine/threonine protein kinase